MHPSVTKDIKAVLDTASAAIKKKNYFALEGLSNRLNHSITIYQSQDVSICSVAVYALSKIFDKQAYLAHPDFNKFRESILATLELARKQDNQYLKHMQNLLTQIQTFSGKLKLYHTPLLMHARSIKAKHAIEHGLSSDVASKLFNVPEQAVSEHMGRSKAHEKHYATPKFNKQRIELLKRLFKI